MLKIPPIIHQTWRDTDIPYHFQILAETWKNMHPDWSYKLWTDAMNRDFIKDNYPWFLEKYDAFPREIQRADAIRYFILLKEGGVYIDIDFECFQNVAGLLSNETCVIGKEPMEHCERFSKDLILCNAFMAATPQNSFIEFTCNKVVAHPCKQSITNNEVLESTGPFILTEAYKQYNKKSQIKILESSSIYPLTIAETRKVFSGEITDSIRKKINNAQAVHYFWGGWW